MWIKKIWHLVLIILRTGETITVDPETGWPRPPTPQERQAKRAWLSDQINLLPVPDQEEIRAVFDAMFDAAYEAVAFGLMSGLAEHKVPLWLRTFARSEPEDRIVMMRELHDDGWMQGFRRVWYWYQAHPQLHGVIQAATIFSVAAFILLATLGISIVIVGTILVAGPYFSALSGVSGAAVLVTVGLALIVAGKRLLRTITGRTQTVGLAEVALVLAFIVGGVLLWVDFAPGLGMANTPPANWREGYAARQGRVTVPVINGLLPSDGVQKDGLVARGCATPCPSEWKREWMPQHLRRTTLGDTARVAVDMDADGRVYQARLESSGNKHLDAMTAAFYTGIVWCVQLPSGECVRPGRPMTVLWEQPY